MPLREVAAHPRPRRQKLKGAASAVTEVGSSLGGRPRLVGFVGGGVGFRVLVPDALEPCDFDVEDGAAGGEGAGAGAGAAATNGKAEAANGEPSAKRQRCD